MGTRLIVLFSFLLLFSCSEEEKKKPEEVLEDFIAAANNSKDLSDYSFPAKASGDYSFSRKFTEKLDPETIHCEDGEDKVKCGCKTVSGKQRFFYLVKDNNEWKVDLNSPEVILEMYHIFIDVCAFDKAISYATSQDKERLNYFMQMSNSEGFPMDQESPSVFEIRCKEFKKKFECSCTDSSGTIFYTVYKTSKGWKAEFVKEDMLDSDTLIDYNNDPNFNLDQKSLDSLTEFSQKMLDSMLNL